MRVSFQFCFITFLCTILPGPTLPRYVIVFGFLLSSPNRALFFVVNPETSGQTFIAFCINFHSFFIQYLLSFHCTWTSEMKGILVLLLISGAVQSFLYFPNIKDLKEFTNIDFQEKPQEKEAESSIPLDLESNPDIQMLIKYMHWQMRTAPKQDMTMNLKNSKKESIQPKLPKDFRDIQYFFRGI